MAKGTVEASSASAVVRKAKRRKAVLTKPIEQASVQLFDAIETLSG
jgi:hypothetical protein